jgi:hypothetical protein
MKSKKIFAITTLFVLSLALFAGAALAQGPDNGKPGGGWPGPMQQWMGPEAWGEMIQHMTETHGPEFTTEMLQRMDETGGCHGEGDYDDMMDGGMMGGAYGGMMGSGIGGGMMGSTF